MENQDPPSLKIKIHPSWQKLLDLEFSKEYFQNIRTFLTAEKATGKQIFPPGSLIFNAFNSTEVDAVKVVIIGQDPYHGLGQAMGLSFSVPRDIPIPASLKNIYKEIETDIQVKMPDHGDLSTWAQQGVFLLNSILTVEQGKPGSHQKTGWQQFTDQVIKRLSDEKTGLIFLLWGNYARNKKSLIDLTKHTVLEAAHPSPLAGGAFMGNRHFSTTNRILMRNQKSPIIWKIEN